MSMKDELIEYKNGGNPLKDRFLAYIKNKTITLDERWETFKEAPVEFLNHETSIVHFKSERLLPGIEIEWYEGGEHSFYIERHQTIEMVDLVEEMMPDHDDIFTEEVINAFKEEILEMGLGSFKYDW